MNGSPRYRFILPALFIFVGVIASASGEEYKFFDANLNKIRQQLEKRGRCITMALAYRLGDVEVCLVENGKLIQISADVPTGLERSGEPVICKVTYRIDDDPARPSSEQVSTCLRAEEKISDDFANNHLFLLIRATASIIEAN